MSEGAAAQFDRVAQAYATSAVHAHGPDLDWMREALRPQPSWQVIDLGAGAGHAALAIAPHVRQVTAVDVSECMVAVAQELARERCLTNIAFRRANVEALPYGEATYDAAISRFSAHHWHTPAQGLREAARVLRAGAPLVLIDTVSPEDAGANTFLNAVELLRDPSHVRDGRLSDWRRMLEEAGFALDAVRTWALTSGTEPWLARAATEPWRADACRRLLREAPDRVRSILAIGEDGARFSLPCALLAARRLA